MNKRKHIKKIIIAALILVFSVASLHLLLTDNSLTPEMAFRRMEKKNMIGPAEIFAVVDFPHGAYDHILIGKSDYGYTFFEYRDEALDSGVLTYVPKKEGATLYCTNYMYGSEKYSSDWTPIFAFTDQKKAVSAKLVLEVTQDGETVTYPLEAEKSPEGYFMFHWETLFLPGEEYWSIQQLIAGQHDGYVLDDCTAQATLELYSSNDTLLETYLFTKE